VRACPRQPPGEGRRPRPGPWPTANAARGLRVNRARW